MAPNTRHLYPEWLRPGNTRGPAAAEEAPERELDGVWQVWEHLRAFDRRFAALVDVALAVALFVVCSFVPVNGVAAKPGLWFVAGLTFPLVFRRRAPMTVFLVIAAVALVQWAVTGPSLADVSLLVALYTVALESEWVLVLTASVVMEAGIVMATVRWKPTGNDVKSLVFLTGLAFTALLAGVVVRALRSQLDWLAERAQRLELERDQQASLAAAAERARIARDMHDVVSHNIQVMTTLADAACAAQASDPARAVEAMQEVSSTGRQALTDMRRMLGVLREEQVGATGMPASPLSPQPGLVDLDALVERVRGTGLPVSLERHGQPFPVSGAASLTAYRIVQEALTNALKHAQEPSGVEVRLDYDDPDLSVRVIDDGHPALAVPGGSAAIGNTNGAAVGNANGAAIANTNGAAVGNTNGAAVGNTNGAAIANTNGAANATGAARRLPSGGHGVAGMTERAAAFGGTLAAGPRPGGGWEVTATLRDCKAPTAT